ncbi:hypothetical protein [Aureimonas populi]|uniref:DUF3072 domain-containing protein n=1 Tax=Aureimonas populi TaxID=1701758 RepID=A0ABW5CHA7_9HYPH|nr:hypothetical protein [Aureimonas populi]
MSRSPYDDGRIVPVDAAVGEDGDSPGIAQPITQAEIDDLVNDAGMPIEERRERLEAIAAALGARDSIDRGGEFGPMQSQIAEALSLLAEGGHAYGTASSTGLDAEARSDARSPDEDDPQR